MKNIPFSLRFGTSGLRDTVENMTDRECYVNTRGFLAYLAEIGEFAPGTTVALGGDRRPSTPRIKRAVAAAIRDKKGDVDDQGLVSSPALAAYAIKRNIPSIMVTGSHIPADRNGIKFTKRSGEVLKSDEKGILSSVANERKKVADLSGNESLFDNRASFTPAAAAAASSLLGETDRSGPAMREYIARYQGIFPHIFPKTRIFLYQHSAVARDAIRELFESYGAEIIAPEVSRAIAYTDEEGNHISETVPLRSADFVPVDTESVSNRTMAIFRSVMNEHHLDIGISMDGDSDRPLLVYRVYQDGNRTDEVSYVTGDILGLLTLFALRRIGVMTNAVAIPVSANDAITIMLKQRRVEITQTKIGSPYVIAAINKSLARHAGQPWNVFAWEANGGFLTGSDITLHGETLTALPTRDAALPLMAVIILSELNKMPIAQLLARLPQRHTHADRKKNFPNETGRAIIEAISPAREEVHHVDFILGEKAFITLADGTVEKEEPGGELHQIRERLQTFFPPGDGFTNITGLNYIDGVRIHFSNSDISHLRPSGNAPEFRNYAIAATPERAKQIVHLGLTKIIPALASIA